MRDKSQVQSEQRTDLGQYLQHILLTQHHSTHTRTRTHTHTYAHTHTHVHRRDIRLISQCVSILEEEEEEERGRGIMVRLCCDAFKREEPCLVMSERLFIISVLQVIQEKG